MADLIPLTRRRAASTGLRQGDANPARFAAIDYVNKILIAPDGSRITDHFDGKERAEVTGTVVQCRTRRGLALHEGTCSAMLNIRAALSENYCETGAQGINSAGLHAPP